jgi:hypothetical protein
VDVRTFELPVGSTLHRIHWAENEPVFFDAGPAGRFNPRDVEGAGCCYLALDPLGAFVEVFRRKFLASDADLAARQLTSGHVARRLRLFDGTARENRFDETVNWESALAAGHHEASQAAASRLWGEVDGVLYNVRHDPESRLQGVALFGDAGQAETSTVLSSAKTDAIPDDVVDRRSACSAM